VNRAVEVGTAEDRELFRAPEGLPALGLDALARHPAGASWMMEDSAGRVVSRCSLWWVETPPDPLHRLGLIGHYAACEAEAGSSLLRLACDQLAARGCTLAVGPMDGNTWQRYRLLSERGPEPTFFLEPDNPDDWPSHFRDSGFHTLANYYSSLNSDLSQRDPRLAEISRRVKALDIAIRPMKLEEFQQELPRLHGLSIASFQHNFLYTPIGLETFAAQYQMIRRHVRPELVLLAERQGDLVGFLFAIPDLLQAQRGQAIDTVVLKTIAVHPELSGLGLGTLLAERCHATSHELGYRRLIHALMHETNRSRAMSAHSARTIRRYTLFAKELGPPA
jgi:L-amino acid N-acyltransferase YncA